MIDTVRMFSQIDKTLYNKIKNQSTIKTSYNMGTGEIFYEIINDSLKGSFDSSLSVRVLEGELYNLNNKFIILIEGSYHKIIKGQNAFDGFYNIQEVACGLIKLAENSYSVNLPNLKHWFLQRIDITKVFDLHSNLKVMNYINNFKLLKYPRRNSKFYENEGVHFSGTSTTVKIYNKYKEFLKHDKQKLKKFGSFDMINFLEKIKGYVRFEVEIKKYKLKDLYKKDFIRIDNLLYSDLEKVWCSEMCKLLKFDYKRLEKIITKEEVFNRLNVVYKTTKASILYSFYLNLVIEGWTKIKAVTPEATFYRKAKALKDLGVDFSQSYSIVIEEDNIINFDVFNNKCEVV